MDIDCPVSVSVDVTLYDTFAMEGTQGHGLDDILRTHTWRRSRSTPGTSMRWYMSRGIDNTSRRIPVANDRQCTPVADAWKTS